jgi:hypothetical protein
MGVPHILQKFIPGGLTVRHDEHALPALAMGTPAIGVGWRTRCAGGITPAWSGNIVGAEAWLLTGAGIACAGPVPGLPGLEAGSRWPQS